MSLFDGTRLMRASFDVVRRKRALLWFPVISTACLVLTAGYWILEGAWLYHVSGRSLYFVPLVIAALYSLAFVGVSIAWNRLGGIAGWAAYSVFVAVVLGFVKSIKGFRWLGTAAEIAWSFATIFVVPLIALQGLDSGSARQSSFQLAKANWRAESGGLGALRVALLIPGGLFYLAGKLLKDGHVHSLAGKALLVAVLVCAFAVSVAAGVVRQVFAVSLYRIATTGGAASA